MPARKLLFIFVLLLLTSCLASSQSMAYSEIAVTPNAHTVVRGDFNTDAAPDLVTGGAGGTLTVLLNNGDGTFNRRDQGVGTTQSISEVAAGDMNRDGRLDLVVQTEPATTSENGSLRVLLGNGDGTFAFAYSSAISTGEIALGDMDGDARLDVVRGWYTSQVSGGVFTANDTIEVRYGDGAGGFSRIRTMQNPGWPSEPGEDKYLVNDVAVADFTGDGRLDILVSECCGGYDVEIGALTLQVQQADGSFVQRNIRQSSVPRELFLTDIDQNGTTDFLYTYAGCHTPCYGLTGMKNDGAANFTGFSIPQLGQGMTESAPNAAATGDFNNDGRKDVVFSVPFTSYTSPSYDLQLVFAVSLQNSDGSFATPTAVASKPYHYNYGEPRYEFEPMAAGDFNRDGRLDVAAGNPTLSQLSLFTNTTASAQQCAPLSGDPSMRICAPASGATVSSPVRILATPNSSQLLSAIKIYVDGVSKFYTLDDRVSTLLPMAAGSHRITVKAWRHDGTSLSASSTFNVGEAPGEEPCSATANRTATICSPANGATVGSPVHLVAAGRSDTGVTGAKVYLDGVAVRTYGAGTTSITTDLAMAAGTHRITVKFWDAAGSFSQSATVTVGSGGSACTASANRTVNICAPANGSTVSSPVRVFAAGRSDSGITGGKVYVDGVSVYSTGAGVSTIDQSFTMAPGARRITVKFWDAAGSFSNTVNVNVQ